MSSFGRNVIGQTGRPIQAAADSTTEWKSGGVTIDWDEVDAVVSDTTLDDGTVVKTGDKYLRFGTVLTLDGDTGKYVPAESGDSLSRDETFIVNQTVLASDLASNHLGVIEGGRVFGDRLVTGGGNPTLENVKAAMPRLVVISD